MIKQNNDYLGKEPIGRLLFKLAVPAITAQVINMLYNLIDRVYIGRIPEVGRLALTGVGVCLPIIMIIAAFAALVSMGGAPRASIFMGEGNNKKAEHVMGNCLSLQIIISIILTVCIFIWKEPILLKFGASNDTISYANDYMGIYALGTIFVQFSLGMNAFISAQGFAKISMFTVLIGAICNIILDPILIFGMNLGVKGAALATIISQAISAVWVLSFLNGKKTILRFKLKNLILKARVIGPCLLLGLAPFVMQASESVITLCFNVSLSKYGGDLAVGAMTILSSVMMFAMLPLQGLSQGAQPITSYNFGAHNYARVKQCFRILCVSCLCFSMILWAVVMIAPTLFAKIFTQDAELILYCKRALRVYIFSTGIFGIQMACQMTFIAIGKATESIFVAVLRKFIMLIPLIYIMPHFVSDKALGVFLAEPIADFLSVVFTSVLFAYEYKRCFKEVDIENYENYEHLY